MNASPILKIIDSTEPYKCQTPTSLPSGLLPVQDFNDSLVPDQLRGWVMDNAERMQCPPDFVAVAAMVSVGAVIGKQVGICPQAHTDWIEFPTLWGCVVGRPGAMKSPAIKSGLAPLRYLENNARTLFDRDLASFTKQTSIRKVQQSAAKSAATKLLKHNPAADMSVLEGLLRERDEPTLKRYMCNDTTAESLGELLRQNENGLLVFRDELVTLLRWLDDANNCTARGLYLQGWDAKGDYTFDRIGRGLNLHVPHVVISMLGGTQPAKISDYLRSAINGGAGDDGLLQRFGMLVWPDQSAEWHDVDRQPDHTLRVKAQRVFEDLASLSPTACQASTDVNNPGCHFLRFDAPALTAFKAWHEQLELRLRSGTLHPALESHLAKYRKLVPSLALISHLVDGAVGNVTLTHLNRALAWATYLESHANRAYGAIIDAQSIATRAIWRKVESTDLATSFTVRDIRLKSWSGLTVQHVIQEGLDMLVDYGWLFDTTISTGGRPSVQYMANEMGLQQKANF